MEGITARSCKVTAPNVFLKKAMTYQQQEIHSSSSPASETRVDIDELAAAVASLHARQEDETRMRAATVAIGDAVQELHLSVAPHEILAEVQAQRAREVRRRRGRSYALRAAGICLLTLLLAGLLTMGVPPLSRSFSQWHARRASQRFDQLLSQSQGPDRKYDLVVYSSIRPRSDLLTYPLSVVPDGHSFHANESDLSRSSGTMPLSFSFRNAHDGTTLRYRTWAFTRYKGRLYRRGWIRASDRNNVLSHRQFDFFPTRELARKLTGAASFLRLTLPQDAPGRYYGGVGIDRWARFDAGTPITLDEHAWEEYR